MFSAPGDVKCLKVLKAKSNMSAESKTKNGSLQEGGGDADNIDQKWAKESKDIEALMDRGTKLVKEHFKDGEERDQLNEGLEAVSKRLKLLEKARTQQQMAIAKVRQRIRSGSDGSQANIEKMYAEAFTG